MITSQHAWSRRRLLTVAGGAAIALPMGSACRFDSDADGGRPADGPGAIRGEQVDGQTGLMLRSNAPLPDPYTLPLAFPQVLAPVRSDARADHYELTARPGEIEILPGLTTPIWSYNGGFPGPTIESRRGRQVVVHTSNELPVPIATHLHGSHTPPDHDGYPTDLVLPAGGWPHHLHPGRVTRQRREYRYPLDQRGALLWYHDHRMDFTAPQVWRGLAGLHLHRDDEESALGLPSGPHELPLMVSDRSFGADGSLLYPSLDDSLTHQHGVRKDFANGVLGDVVLVNGVPSPHHDVARGSYRLRLVNASNARHYWFELDPLPSAGEAVVQIGTDGGLMAASQVVRSFGLAPAERIDLVIDFSLWNEGDRVRLRNTSVSGPTSEVLEFRVTGDTAPRWTPPKRLSDVERLRPERAVRTRKFTFARRAAPEGAVWPIGGHLFRTERIAATPRHGDVEIWEFSSDLTHPVHLHHVKFQVLGDYGPAAWKDVVGLGPNDSARVIVRFEGHRGRYVMHCHNLEHEDMGMMANFSIV